MLYPTAFVSFCFFGFFISEPMIVLWVWLIWVAFWRDWSSYRGTFTRPLIYLSIEVLNTCELILFPFVGLLLVVLDYNPEVLVFRDTDFRCFSLLAADRVRLFPDLSWECIELCVSFIAWLRFPNSCALSFADAFIGFYVLWKTSFLDSAFLLLKLFP